MQPAYRNRSFCQGRYHSHLAFEGSQTRWFRHRCKGRDPDSVFRECSQPDLVGFRQGSVQKMEFARQFIAHLRDKRPGILGEAKALIICISLHFEIGRQVIVRVA